MKRLLLAAFAGGLIGCANQPAAPPGPAVTGGYPYSRYSTTADVSGYRSPTYRSWSTAQLQDRRLELYAMNPLTQTREGVPAYIYHGQATPSQDEIKPIEAKIEHGLNAAVSPPRGG